MSSGRTHWRPKDSAWWRRERIVAVGLQVGPAGPAVQDWLECEATAQNDHGWVKAGYAAIAHGACFGHLTAVQVRPVVSELVRVGLLDEFEDAGATFTCRISGWKQDVEMPLEATRKAAERAAAKAAKLAAEPKPEHGQPGTPADTSGPVRERPGSSPTEHDIREQRKTPLPPEGGEVPTPPTKNRKTDLARFETQVAEFAAQHFPDLPEAERPGLVKNAISHLNARGQTVTTEAVQGYVRRFRPEAAAA